MREIAVGSFQTTGLSPSFDTVRTVAIEDMPLGQGGFGEVYRAVNFDGRRVQPQVVKLLIDNGHGAAVRGFATIQELQRRVQLCNRELLSTNGRSVFDDFPALFALPQFSFEGRLDGKPVLGYCSNDLVSAGYEEFGDVLDDDAKISQLQSLPLAAKLKIASQLVGAFQFLSSRLLFIHADIKAEALFVDLRRLRCAIIDFDSGAVARDPSDKPTTFGTKQDWLAPEICKQIDTSGNSACVIKVDLLSDIWSVNIAVHYLLFGFHPLFFLTEISDRSLKAYRNQFSWPDISANFPYFRGEYAAIYRQYAAFLRSKVPAEVVNRLAFTINKGYYDPTARTTYGQWKAVLGTINRLSIRQFSADRSVVTDARPVRLTWEVTGAVRAEITGVGDVIDKTFVDIGVRRDTEYTLVVMSEDGACLRKSVRVQVRSIPAAIHSFTSSTTGLTGPTPARLAWNVSGAERLEIDQGIGDVTARPFVNVLPRRDTTYTLTVTNPFGQVARASLRLTVSQVAPTIELFKSDQAVVTSPVPVELRWRVSDDAHQVFVDSVGPTAKQGRIRVAPKADTVYILRAISFFGCTSERQVEVKVSKEPPTIESFSAAPVFVREGELTELRWKVTGASEARIDPKIGPVPVEGCRKVSLSRDAEFVLTASSYFGIVAEARLSIRSLRMTALKTHCLSATDPLNPRSSGPIRRSMETRTTPLQAASSRLWRGHHDSGS